MPIPNAIWGVLGKSDIEALLGARPVAKTPHFTLHWLSPSPSPVVGELSTEGAPVLELSVDNLAAEFLHPARSGLATLVPKRHARRAVTRNLIKRQARAAVRHYRAVLPAGKLLIRLRAAFDTKRFPSAASPALCTAVRSELDALLAQHVARP